MQKKVREGRHRYFYLFQNKNYMESLIRDFISEDLYKGLDFSEGRAHIQKSYLESTAVWDEDLIYEAKCNGQRIFFYLLFGSKHSDYFTSLDLMYNICQFWKEYVNEHRGKIYSLPFVLPIIVYTGEREWTVPLTMKEIIDKHPLLQRVYPDLTYLKLISSEHTTESLRDNKSHLGKVLMMETFDEEEINSIVDNFNTVFQDEDMQTITAIALWIKQLVKEKKFTKKRVVKADLFTKNSSVSTQLNEWTRRMKSEAKQEALMESCHKMVEEKIPWETITKITEVSEDVYLEWRKKNIIE